MASRVFGPATLWAALVAATLLSFLSWLDPGSGDPRLAGSVVLVIALAKAWLIGMRYMELGEAIVPLRAAYGIWIIAVGAMLLTMTWLA